MSEEALWVPGFRFIKRDRICYFRVTSDGQETWMLYLPGPDGGHLGTLVATK